MTDDTITMRDYVPVKDRFSARGFCIDDRVTLTEKGAAQLYGGAHSGDEGVVVGLLRNNFYVRIKWGWRHTEQAVSVYHLEKATVRGSGVPPMAAEKCERWLDDCRQSGWEENAIADLRALWWRYHT